MTADPAGTAYAELVDAIAGVADLVRHPARGRADPSERAAGYLYATELTRLALALYADSDGDHPRFVPMSSPTPYHGGQLQLLRVAGGANPDGLYDLSVLRPDRSYRISGRRGNDCYFSLSFSGGKDGEWPERTAATFNDRQLVMGPDGTFEIIVSADERPGNWVRMEPDICSVIVRQYFAVPPAERVPATLRIEVLDQPPVTDPAEDAARRIRTAAAFIRSTGQGFPMQPAPLNQFTDPLGYTGEAGALGTTDNTYCMGRWHLEPGERLVIDAEPTAAAYWSLQAWNHWGQSLLPTIDEANYQSQIVSSSSAVRNADGTVRVVLSEHDPGEPNWLPTHGWRDGALIFRFLYPEERPVAPLCKVL